ncbi:MAG: efflux RND transporter periplasmic adaptor subunit [Candidatus Binatia bacterium]|nr:efflux RND transporter periplasmic adaptor subunit [Candidatus Binatia bacterium]
MWRAKRWQCSKRWDVVVVGWVSSVALFAASGNITAGGEEVHIATVTPAAESVRSASRTPQAGSPQTLWTCSMHPQVVRDQPGNCPICGMQLTPLGSRKEVAKREAGERKIKYWWDPMMSPPYISDRPGKSPMGMDLIPVYEDEVVAGQVIVIDPRLEQNMGLRVEEVRRGPLRTSVRAYAQVREPESTVREFSLRVSGWIVRLYANYTGAHMAKGAPLLELYSPELQTAVAEWIAAVSAPGATPSVRAASRRKLDLLGLEAAQIDALSQLREPPPTVTFRAPYSAHVVEKLVNEGVRVEAGQPLLRLNDRSRMWLDAEVYEQDLCAVRLGQSIEARILALPGRVFHGTVTFIHPHVEGPARTIVVRSELPNDEGLLRQGMAATVVISGEILPEAVLVPREAVIDTGERKVVFVVTDPGHFEPRTVETGPAGADGLVSIVSGLAPGERVVVSGQFLLDAESRLREAARKFVRPAQEAGSHGRHSH